MLKQVLSTVAATSAHALVRPAVFSKTAWTVASAGLCVAATVGAATVVADEGSSKPRTPVRYNPDGVVLVPSKAVRRLMTTIRDKNSKSTEYVFAADRMMTLLAEEALATLPGRSATMHSPCGPFDGEIGPAPTDIAVVSIMRAGDSLADVIRRLIPECSVGKILIQRDESDPFKRSKLFYSKLPKNMNQKHVLLVDPMLATGGSAIQAIKVLTEAGVPPERILFVNLLCAPEGLAAMQAAFPQVRVVTCSIDSHLNDHKYIVPGLGDAGDRYYGTQ